MRDAGTAAALVAALWLGAVPLHAADDLTAEIDRLAAAVEPHVIEYRRHIHEHPELGNREFETAKYVAAHLQKLGLEVQTGVAKTGVVAVLRGGRPGSVVALRADLDALPLVEDVDLPFKSKVRTTFDGQEVGVMHACGHDAHTGILMGVAEVLAQVRERIPGTVKLIFQPAEEGPPAGEDGGAELMVREGVLKRDPAPKAIFALHTFTVRETGYVGYTSGPTFASSDDLRIVVHGKGTHGAAPWRGVDPIVVAAQIVLALQTIPSRQLDISRQPAIVTIGRIEGGVRNNIIPDSVEMKGTLRALDDEMREELLKRVKRTAQDIATSAGARAEVLIGESTQYPVTVNDPALVQRMLPTLQRAFGDKAVEERPMLGAEDFAFFSRVIPGFYVRLGVRKPGASMDEYPSNHSPRFRVDEAALEVGVRALAHLAVDWLQQEAPP